MARPHLVRLTVNGTPVEATVEPAVLLLDFLREQLGLTGTKEGCGTGDCGACTVIVDGKPMHACLTLAVEADGCEVLTIEGLARNGELHPIQAALVEYGGLQCGFCTPGIIMMAKTLLDRNPHPTEEELRMGLAGNLCRCTGYQKIIEALQAVIEGRPLTVSTKVVAPLPPEPEGE